MSSTTDGSHKGERRESHAPSGSGAAAASHQQQKRRGGDEGVVNSPPAAAAASSNSNLSFAHLTPSNWLFTKEELNDSPSARDGFSFAHEASFRRSTCGFLQEVGMKLRMPHLSIATAIVFFHRYYAVYSFKHSDRYTLATAALFLSGKVEESPKKLRDVISFADMVRNKSTKESFEPESPEYLKRRDEVLLAERSVLQTMAFDLVVEHPYKHLLAYVKTLKGNQSNESFKNLAQVAWNFVNDSLRTTLCLQYRPQLIACAAIQLASKYLQIPLPDATVEGIGRKTWWEALEIKGALADLDAIGQQIIDLYEQPGGAGGATGGPLKTPSAALLSAVQAQLGTIATEHCCPTTPPMSSTSMATAVVKPPAISTSGGTVATTSATVAPAGAADASEIIAPTIATTTMTTSAGVSNAVSRSGTSSSSSSTAAASGTLDPIAAMSATSTSSNTAEISSAPSLSLDLKLINSAPLPPIASAVTSSTAASSSSSASVDRTGSNGKSRKEERVERRFHPY